MKNWLKKAKNKISKFCKKIDFRMPKLKEIPTSAKDKKDILFKKFSRKDK
jgi:hypothetical protein